MSHPVHQESSSARTRAADCLAWHIDPPTGTSFLAGSILADAIGSTARTFGYDLARAENVATLAGLGNTARIDGSFVAIGTPSLFATLDIAISPAIMATIAQIRRRGNEAVLVRGWKGVRHVGEILNPASSGLAPVQAA
ncbi:MAG: hypothetical protein WBA46_05240 [Thermomicrobiales bacterium]